MHNDRAAVIIQHAMRRERREVARSRWIRAVCIAAVLASILAVPPATSVAKAPPPEQPAPVAFFKEIWDWLTGRPPEPPTKPPAKHRLIVAGSEG